MKEELEKALKDPKALEELQKQVGKAFRELDKLFGGGEKEEKKEKAEPPEGKELDKEIKRMLDLLRKRVQEREKKSKQEELKEKIEKELDEAFGKSRKEKPEQPGQPRKGRPFIGFRVSEPEEALRYQLGLKGGLLVDEVKPDSPAAKAGLKAGDIIVKIDQ
jgi:C-terminal processing protease CtpA/Prc